MSTCHSPQTTDKLCDHGIPPEYECNVCSGKMKLNRAEDFDVHIPLCEHGMPNKAHCYKCNNIVIHDPIKDCFERIYELEKKVCGIFSTQEKRFEELETFKNLRYTKFENKPHKCPNCSGIGEIMDEYGIPGETLKHYQRQDKFGLWRRCISCEGKGILWE